MRPTVVLPDNYGYAESLVSLVQAQVLGEASGLFIMAHEGCQEDDGAEGHRVLHTDNVVFSEVFNR